MLVGCGPSIEINNTVDSSSEVHDSFRYGNSPISTNLKLFPVDNRLVVVGEVLEVSVNDITSSSQQRSELSNLLSIMQPSSLQAIFTSLAFKANLCIKPY